MLKKLKAHVDLDRDHHCVARRKAILRRLSVCAELAEGSGHAGTALKWGVADTTGGDCKPSTF